MSLTPLQWALTYPALSYPEYSVIWRRFFYTVDVPLFRILLFVVCGESALDQLASGLDDAKVPQLFPEEFEKHSITLNSSIHIGASVLRIKQCSVGLVMDITQHVFHRFLTGLS